jgi:hypothetical protein
LGCVRAARSRGRRSLPTRRDSPFSTPTRTGGAVLALSSSMDQHRDQPGVIVRLLVGTSVADLVERHADLFAGLRLLD